MAAVSPPKLYSQFLTIVLLGGLTLLIVSWKNVIPVPSTGARQQALESFVDSSVSTTADTVAVTAGRNSLSNNTSWPVPLQLPLPVLVVGYPKSGTTSVHHFFNCSRVVTQHFCCCGDTNDHPPCQGNTMAVCILNNMARPGRKMLQDCGNYQVYGQIDGERPIRRKRGVPQHVQGILLEDGSLELHDTKTKLGRMAMYRHFLPQHFYLERLSQEYPQATLVLSLRNSTQWAQSVFNWFQMRGRVVNEYIYFNKTIERPGKHRAIEFLVRIYDEHTALVRQFVQDHPSHTLVEINITDPNAGNILGDAFGLDPQCWGHHNKLGNRAKNKKKARFDERHGNNTITG